MGIARPVLASEVLAGGGEVGVLMRQLDWAATPLGPVAQWPQALRTAVGIVLGSRLPLAIFWGPEFVLLYNDASLPMMGSKHPACIGQPALRCWPEVKDSLGPMLQEVLATGTATHLTDGLVANRKGDFLEELYYTWSYSPIRLDSGAIGGVLQSATDTTAEVLGKRRQRVLHNLAAIRTSVGGTDLVCAAAARALDESDVPFALIYLNDDDARFVRLGAAAGIEAGLLQSPKFIDRTAPGNAWPLADIERTGEAQLVGDLAAKFGPQPARGWPAPAQTALVLPLLRPCAEHAHGVLVAGLSAGLHLDASYRDFLHLVAGHIATSLAQVKAMDATLERNGLLEELSHRAEQALQADQRKDEFLAMLAHELRNPLAALSSAMQLLGLRGSVESTDVGPQAICERQLGKLTRIVDDLLDVARITQGKVDLQKVPMDLGKIVQSALQTLRPQLGVREHEISVTIGPGKFRMEGDPTRLEQVFNNLLSNAAKYTPASGHIAVRVLREDSQGTAWAVVEVSDSGRGIRPEMLARVFDLFVQEERTLSRREGGLGIGLTLVRSLVELHGGEVSAKSEGQGRGSIFTVRLPMGLTAAPMVAAVAAPQEAAAPPVESCRIVIVEDDEDVRSLFKEMLESYGHKVSSAGDGQAGRDLVLSERPDFALIDVGLPGLDGYQVATQLRAAPELADTYLVALTGYGGPAAVKRALDAGFDEHLVKPVKLKELQRMLLRIHGQRQALAQAG